MNPGRETRESRLLHREKVGVAKLGFVAATVSGAPLTTLKYEGGAGAEKCSFRRDFFAFPSEDSHVVAARQIDAWSDPQDGSRTFDGFWIEQAATQTTRKVAGRATGTKLEPRRRFKVFRKAA